MQNGDPRPLFFVHIQKTAGGTLRSYLRSNLEPGAIYPEGSYDNRPMDSYWEIDRLLAISPERRAEIRAYVGHFPYIAAELLDIDLVTMTVLRDPIERTISYLKMRSRDPGRRQMTFEEIYDDPFDFPCFIQNHQAKVFAMTRDDKLETFMDVIDVDADRLAIAKANLEKVDLIGLQEHTDQIVAQLAARYGWASTATEDTHVSAAEWTVPDSFRQRIAEDNAADVEFYEFGRALHRERTRALER